MPYNTEFEYIADFINATLQKCKTACIIQLPVSADELTAPPMPR